MNLHPLLARLAERTGASVLAPDTVEAFATAPGAGVLFFSGDPVRFPEALDVAVVLPELRAQAGEAFRVGIVAREGEDAIARRFGVLRWPSMVFVRDGQYLATLCGMQDWEPFVAQVRDALAAPPSRPPTVGIPVVGAAAGRTCG